MRSMALSITMLGLAACDGAVAPPDAGADGATEDGGSDAGSFDPTTSRFEPVVTEGEGPWGLWGYMVVSLDADRAILVGGTDAGALGGTVFDAAWDVTIGDGTVSATALETSGPAPRYCACAGYDPMRDVVVVFGGRDLSGPSLAAETWELALATRTWTQIEAVTQPPGTIGCAMAWAPDAEAMFLFGGGGAGGFSADTFRYDAGAWTALDAAGPLARYDAVMVPSAEGDALLLFGGSYGATGAVFYADLWRFDPAAITWTEIELPEGPGGRRIPWIVRDPERDGLYVGFGYDGAMQPYGDLWYLDLARRTWTEIDLGDEGPYWRGFAPALPGGASSLGTVIGGYGSIQPTTDAWQLRR